MYILPNPQKIDIQKGFFTVRYDSRIFIDSSCSADLYHTALLLQKEFKDCCGFHLPIIRSHIARPKECIYLTSLAPANEQTYNLVINENGVTIKGSGNAGILYGVQTLRQIIRQSGAQLPCLSITDHPSVLNRGFYYDTSRGRIPTLDYLKDMADSLSYYKINQLQLYVEHSYLFTNLSEVWRDDTPLTAEDILELDDYCRKLEIELVPSLASFGHLCKLLSTKTYHHLCELEGSDKAPFSFRDRMHHHTINCSDPESFELIKSLLSEYMQLFTSKQFNICADETFDLGKGKNHIRAEQEGVTAVYTDFLTKLSNFITDNGRIPMFWSDIICEEPSAYRQLPEELICLHWDYDPDPSEDRLGKLVEAGAKQLYVCPGVHGWNHLINVHHNAYKNIAAMCRYGHRYHTMGVLTTDWGDFGHINHPSFSRLGMIYGAAFSWNDRIIPEEEINRQISMVEYGDSSLTLASTFEKISRFEAFPWENAVLVMEALSNHNDPVLARECMDICDPRLAEKYNLNIDEQLTVLYGLLNSLPASAKDVVNAYLIAGEGQKLLNKLLPILCRHLNEIPEADPSSPAKLAVELENWLVAYRALWKTVSRESEFYRVANVYYWYADYLRAL
ncbi:MAG: family 20 glycosylhydrolase [Lachnospiraceae bacterium]|nr:family 20 glycosylhydrolase [Lachnospiraceae bacterium]